MAAGDAKVIRTLHLRFTMPSADPAQLSALIKSAKPFYEFFGTTRVRLLQNVDDPGRFIQVIDYETDEAMELNRQRIASDPRLQSFIQAWRAMLPGAVEVDVFQEV
ncbi:MAG TPA: hypothetical protein VKX28_10005 [Xanthobacteraceae bacterium]|jgi:hypothetical protein|nr:hypothetical protein [Xanthobacteraceae bacterium]